MYRASHVHNSSTGSNLASYPRGHELCSTGAAHKACCLRLWLFHSVYGAIDARAHRGRYYHGCCLTYLYCAIDARAHRARYYHGCCLTYLYGAIDARAHRAWYAAIQATDNSSCQGGRQAIGEAAGIQGLPHL
eukprot:1140792-Pelagomonas_calceolata.AAC.2